MGWRAQFGGVALVAMLALSLVFSASASAAITFTSAPPSPAVAGAVYEVSATDSTGTPVALTVESARKYPVACTYTKPPAEPTLAEEATAQAPAPGPGPEQKSPATVYLVEAGVCTIVASAEGTKVSQTITVEKNLSAKIAFTTPTPTGAMVGGSYAPAVRPSAGIAVHFSTPTGYVCAIERGTVILLHPGTCKVYVRQSGPNSEPPEAEQSFNVSEPSNAGKPNTAGTTTPNGKKTPGKSKAKARISAKARALLLREALAVAARHRDRHPSLIQAVRVTEAQAEQLETETRQGTTLRSNGTAPVYFVAMRGSFSGGCARGSGFPRARPACPSPHAQAVRHDGEDNRHEPHPRLPGSPIGRHPGSAETIP